MRHYAAMFRFRACHSCSVTGTSASAPGPPRDVPPQQLVSLSITCPFLGWVRLCRRETGPSRIWPSWPNWSKTGLCLAACFLSSPSGSSCKAKGRAHVEFWLLGFLQGRMSHARQALDAGAFWSILVDSRTEIPYHAPFRLLSLGRRHASTTTVRRRV